MALTNFHHDTLIEEIHPLQKRSTNVKKVEMLFAIVFFRVFQSKSTKCMKSEDLKLVVKSTAKLRGYKCHGNGFGQDL